METCQEGIECLQEAWTTLGIMTKAATTTCDACGTRYVFTNYKDRCPVCCPDQAHKDDVSDNNEQADWWDDDND